jgi:osmotically-inducible protein OsmY/sporulation protein YlmC with PRC-barrel domain
VSLSIIGNRWIALVPEFAIRRQEIKMLDLDIGARVLCEGEPCGKLARVVLDPHTERVTHLIVERGLLRKVDRVVPVSAVGRTTDQDIHLSIRRDELEEYPEYRETEFGRPTPGWEENKQYKTEHVRFQAGSMHQESPVAPRVWRQVRDGIPSDAEVIERGAPVYNAAGVVGKVDHLLVDKASGEIAQLVVRRGIIPEYPIVPIEAVHKVMEGSVAILLTDEELEELPRHTRRADIEILAELEDYLQTLSLDLSGVKRTVKDGILKLTGLVSDAGAKRHIEATARSVPGVIDVENILDTDAAIAARVTVALLDDPRTGTSVIETISQRGTVTLKGQVDSPEIREAAEEVATQQTGVISVVNGLEVQHDADTDALMPQEAVMAYAQSKLSGTSPK